MTSSINNPFAMMGTMLEESNNNNNVIYGNQRGGMEDNVMKTNSFLVQKVREIADSKAFKNVKIVEIQAVCLMVVNEKGEGMPMIPTDRTNLFFKGNGNCWKIYADNNSTKELTDSNVKDYFEQKNKLEFTEKIPKFSFESRVEQASQISVPQFQQNQQPSQQKQVTKTTIKSGKQEKEEEEEMSTSDKKRKGKKNEESLEDKMKSESLESIKSECGKKSKPKVEMVAEQILNDDIFQSFKEWQKKASKFRNSNNEKIEFISYPEAANEELWKSEDGLAKKPQHEKNAIMKERVEKLEALEKKYNRPQSNESENIKKLKMGLMEVDMSIGIEVAIGGCPIVDHENGEIYRVFFKAVQKGPKIDKTIQIINCGEDGYTVDEKNAVYEQKFATDSKEISHWSIALREIFFLAGIKLSATITEVKGKLSSVNVKALPDDLAKKEIFVATKAPEGKHGDQGMVNVEKIIASKFTSPSLLPRKPKEEEKSVKKGGNKKRKENSNNNNNNNEDEETIKSSSEKEKKKIKGKKTKTKKGKEGKEKSDSDSDSSSSSSSSESESDNEEPENKKSKHNDDESGNKNKSSTKTLTSTKTSNTSSKNSVNKPFVNPKKGGE